MSHLSKNSEEHGMKRRNGFSLLELMVSMAVTVTVLGAATAALLQAQHATQAIAMQANTQENLRAGMHFMVRDIAQAGEGIPQGGITIPYGATSLVNRPGIAGTFPTTYTAIPAITPGSQLGQFATSINPNTNLPLVSGTRTDIINILYNDDTLVDAVGNHLYSFPVVQAAPAVPVCAGVISPTGAFVTMTPACFLMPGVVQPISAGNLIMFHNQNGTALEYVTSVAGNTINFAAGDPAGLNQTGKANGTVANLGPGGVFPPTTITRVWMVTYYVDFTNPAAPQLVRQVNYPNYPAAAPANPPLDIADMIEDLSFSYDLTGSSDAVGVYPLGPGNAPTPILPDTPGLIRAVNIFAAGRSENTYTALSSPEFIRNNLSTQVCVRSLAFTNQFQTSATQTTP
jgi:prepilin-type N-terminal cleavage/methylation domain-containing protein